MRRTKGILMADKTYKLIDIVATSEQSVSEAIRNGVKKAGETLHNLDWVEVQQIRARVDNGKVSQFQVEMKVGFRLD
jgi:flavin-binding protein dodecin